jgi:ribosomal protein S18 acetylase RimI-like enzyme
METHSPKYVVRRLEEDTFDWFVNTAAVNMLTVELNREELVNLERINELSLKVMEEGTAFVVLSNNIPVGAIAGIVISNLYNPNIVTLTELFWYVLPEYRSTRVGYMLLKALEKRAGEVANELTLSILPHSEVNIDTLEKRGFKFEELGFRKVL